MVYSTAASAPAYYVDMMFFHKSWVNFLRSVLIAADNNGIVILPKE